MHLKIWEEEEVKKEKEKEKKEEKQQPETTHAVKPPRRLRIHRAFLNAIPPRVFSVSFSPTSFSASCRVRIPSRVLIQA